MTVPAYLICATPRSGSTLLCDLLTDCGAGRPASYWRPQDIGRWAERWGIVGGPAADDPVFNAAYLQAMIAAGSAGSDVFGLRLMWSNAGEATARLRAALGRDSDLATLTEAAFGRTLFIHLSRQDVLAQAISLVRAEQTGCGMSPPTGPSGSGPVGRASRSSTRAGLPRCATR